MCDDIHSFHVRSHESVNCTHYSGTLREDFDCFRVWRQLLHVDMSIHLLTADVGCEISLLSVGFLSMISQFRIVEVLDDETGACICTGYIISFRARALSRVSVLRGLRLRGLCYETVISFKYLIYQLDMFTFADLELEKADLTRTTKDFTGKCK